MKTLKIFAPKNEHAAIEALGRPVARYDAFVVVQVDEAAARKLAKQHPSEDISAQYQLPLGGAERDPLTAAPATRGRGAPAVVDDQPHHYLVQFVGPVKREWVAALRDSGATLRHPTGGFGYVVRADAATLAKIKALSCVRWTGHLPHADRVAPALGAGGAAAPMPRRRELPGSLTLEVFDAADLQRIADAAAKLGFAVASSNQRARRLTLRFDGAAGQLKAQVAALSAVHGVRWIQPRTMPRTSNNVASRIVGRDAVAKPPPALGLTGQGEIVAVCDTGLDTGDANALHPDFMGRVVAVKSYPITAAWKTDVSNVGADDGPADTDSGHGTHVAGSVLGDGSASAAGPDRIEGMAPKARLIFQAVEQEVKWKPHVPKKIAAERFQLAGIPDDLHGLLNFAYTRGARVHSNSWGGGEPGEYDAQCEDIDRFVWEHKDLCVVVAAGNDGSDTGGKGLPANGRINPTSVGSPATAKNCITVGASENLRPEFDAELYGDWWPDDFPRAPFKAQPMADDPEQVAAFSSRGPTVDGRVKPDVVAPGTFVLSTRSSRIGSNNFAWGAYGPNKRQYMHMGGTSMATPIVAGCAALVREFLRTRRGIATPSAALVKALLIAGTRRLPIGGRDTPADNAQGFGRIDLRRSLGRVLLTHEERPGVRTGTMARVALDVPAGRRELRVVLAYTDYPGSELINNLNLFVIDPTGRRRVGNADGASLTLDAKNNVELVRVASAAKGAWAIEVVGSNVLQGPQDFALAAVLV